MEDWVKRFREIPLVKLLRESECIAHDGDDQDLANIMTEVNKHEWDKIEDFISEELDKAREEGYQNCMDDIWEEAKGLRSWTEHDGSISSADIEAGLQEAYLNIEDKLKDNK